MLIDTHCHLDATEFDLDRDSVIANAVLHKVSTMVVPAVERANFQPVINLSAIRFFQNQVWRIRKCQS